MIVTSSIIPVVIHATFSSRLHAHPVLSSSLPAVIDTSSLTATAISGGTSSLASMATLVLESVPDTWTELQQVGENTFAAAFFIAFLQAMVALLQYRNNPSGQLVIPPGHTYGTEHPRENHHHVNRVKTNDRTNNHPGNKENNLEDETNEEEDTSWFGALRDLESSFDRHRRKKDERNIKTDSSDLTSISVLQTAAQRYSAIGRDQGHVLLSMNV